MRFVCILKALSADKRKVFGHLRRNKFVIYGAEFMWHVVLNCSWTMEFFYICWSITAQYSFLFIRMDEILNISLPQFCSVGAHEPGNLHITILLKYNFWLCLQCVDNEVQIWLPLPLPLSQSDASILSG